jgi:hypothetical protein
MCCANALPRAAAVVQYRVPAAERVRGASCALLVLLIYHLVFYCGVCETLVLQRTSGSEIAVSWYY